MGLDGPTLTAAHVVISLIAIVSGAVVCYGLLAAKRLELWTAVFLATTVLTSVTGFIFFPIQRFTPGIGIWIISLIVPAVAILARYHYRLAGGWRSAYVISSVAACYFNALVLHSIVPEGSGAGGARANAVGTAVRGSAARRPGRIHRDWGPGHEAFSRPNRPDTYWRSRFDRSTPRGRGG